MTIICEYWISVYRIPYLHRAITAARSDKSTVGRPCQRVDRSGMSPVAKTTDAVARIPDCDGCIIRARGDACSIRRPGDDVDLPALACKLADIGADARRGCRLRRGLLRWSGRRLRCGLRSWSSCWLRCGLLCWSGRRLRCGLSRRL